MKFTSFACLVCGALSLGFVSSASAQTAYMGNHLGGPFIHEVVIATGAVVTSTPISTGQHLFSLDQHPASGQTYAILAATGTAGFSRDLATLDLVTGVANTIGAMGDSFNALAFDNTGTLWATTGNGANTTESLWTVDITTGAPTFVMTLRSSPADDDGESLGFNPDDGLLYHGEGFSAQRFESIDPVTLARTEIPLSQNGQDDEWLGMAYMGNNTFLVLDRDREWWTVTTSGQMTLQNFNNIYGRGMAIPPGSGPIGTNYCTPAVPNSTGVPGVISAIGSLLVAANDVTLTAAQLPGGQFGYFLTSQSQGFFMPPGSSGFICLGGNIGRYNGNVGQGPSFSLQIDLTSMPVNPPQAVVPGDTWNFQAWYRDVGNSNNFTDGLSATFQ